MNEIQRYGLVVKGGTTWLEKRSDGEWCHYNHLRWCQRQYWMAVFINIVVVLACAVLAALLVHEKASHGPVAVPMGAGEKAELLKEVHAAKVAKDQAQADLKTARADYAASQAFFANRAKELEGKIAKDIQSLESPAARVQEMDRLNHEREQRMSTRQGLVLEAKRVLGVNVKVIE